MAHHGRYHSGINNRFIVPYIFVSLLVFLATHLPFVAATTSAASISASERAPTAGSASTLDGGNRKIKNFNDYKSRKLNPTSGEIRVLVVPVYFSNHANIDLPEQSYIQSLFSDEIARWFELNSYGNFVMDPVVTDWLPLDSTESSAAGGASGYTDNIEQAFWPALNALDSRPGWDWSQFDSNNDGKLDGVMFIHSGYAAEQTNKCDDTPPSDRLWSRGFGGADPNSWKSSDGSYILDGWLIASAFDGQLCEPAAIGTITHELHHTFDGAIPDLYDTSSDRIGNGVGAFDIMGHLYGPKNNPSFPGHLSTWTKMQLGWLTPTQIQFDGVYTLRPAEITEDAYIIRFGPFPPKLFEYLLFENRQQIEYDADLWSSGLLIYHVDDFANGQAMRGFPGQAGWPGNGNHYQVAVLQADGQYDLELGINRGDATDFWTPGMVLGPGQGNTVFPNTDSYQGGNIAETGITITVLESSSPELVTFRVEGLAPAQPTPKPTPAPVAIPTPRPTAAPVVIPTSGPTAAPVVLSTPRPTAAPVVLATPGPTAAPARVTTPVPVTPQSDTLTDTDVERDIDTDAETETTVVDNEATTVVDDETTTVMDDEATTEGTSSANKNSTPFISSLVVILFVCVLR